MIKDHGLAQSIPNLCIHESFGVYEVDQIDAHWSVMDIPDGNILRSSIKNALKNYLTPHDMKTKTMYSYHRIEQSAIPHTDDIDRNTYLFAITVPEGCFLFEGKDFVRLQDNHMYSFNDFLQHAVLNPFGELLEILTVSRPIERG